MNEWPALSSPTESRSVRRGAPPQAAETLSMEGVSRAGRLHRCGRADARVHHPARVHARVRAEVVCCCEQVGGLPLDLHLRIRGHVLLRDALGTGCAPRARLAAEFVCNLHVAARTQTCSRIVVLHCTSRRIGGTVDTQWHCRYIYRVDTQWYCRLIYRKDPGYACDWVLTRLS